MYLPSRLMVYPGLRLREEGQGLGLWLDCKPTSVSACPRVRAGTIAYMSPELLQHGRLTKLNDVYSFAMLLIELWSSKRLFQGLSQQQARPPLRLVYA